MLKPDFHTSQVLLSRVFWNLRQQKDELVMKPAGVNRIQAAAT